jgi:hypothetical protein
VHRFPGRSARALGAALATLFALEAGAHIAPSLDENNRYLKIQPMGDRIRLVYTIYMGERPGAVARRRIDQDGDGLIDAAESARYGDELAAAVRERVEITVDGEPWRGAWDQVHVGLGTPTTRGGAFAVDLVAWLCLGRPAPGGEHRLVVFDRFEIPQPGETEVFIEEAPGISIVRATLGPDGGPSQLHFRWLGGPGPAAELGLHLHYQVDRAVAATAGDERCEDRVAGPSDRRRGALAAGLAGAVLALALAGLWLRRRYRKTNG